MAEGFAQVIDFVDDLQKSTDEAMRRAGREIGDVGRREVLDLAVSLFGSDRKFSGARGSKTAGRVAGARYRAFPDRVEIYPTGDPFYIFLKGRGRSNIAPKKRAGRGRGGGVKTPFGVFRRVHGGRLAPRPPSILEPAERATATKATKILADAIIQGAARSI